MKFGTLLFVYLIVSTVVYSQDTVVINGKEIILKGEKIIEYPSEKCFYEDTSYSARVYHDDGTFHFESQEGKTIFSVKRLEIRNDSMIYLEYTDRSGIKLLRLYKYYLKTDSKYTGYIRRSSIGLGCYYRGADAVAVNMLLEMGQYAIGLSYDLNTSGLKKVSTMRGGPEIVIRFNSANRFLFQKR